MKYATCDDLDQAEFNKLLDRAKTQIFMGSNSAFFGSVLCGMEGVVFTRDCPTAATDGIHIFWNPEFFMRSDEYTRGSTIRHELEHVARLHMLRRGERDPKLWNYVCDARINDGMKKEKRIFNGINVIYDTRCDDLSEEEAYAKLQEENFEPQGKAFSNPGDSGGEDFEGDMEPTSQADQVKIINNVVNAIQSAKMAGKPGDVPGDIQEIVSKFLTPKIHWEVELMKFFTEMVQGGWSWKRPNRRYEDIYMPGRDEDDGRIESLNYYLDVSGSVTEAQVRRFNSEVRYIWNELKPKKLTLITFDVKIQDELEFNEGDPFERIEIHGRGGTSVVCVKEHIEKHRPQAAIIFSDMEFTPMEKPKANTELIWVAINSKIKGLWGRTIHINE